MAHRESIQAELLRAFFTGTSFYWNVSSSVGYTCRNKKEDVLLVQFFLNAIFDDLEEDGAKCKVPARLVPDGSFGGKTWGAIKWFQKEVKLNLVADGMVSATDGTRYFTPKRGMMYTIHALNGIYRYSRSHYFDDIRKDSSIPAVLSSHLSGPLPDLL
jgi:hypothetical protein